MTIKAEIVADSINEYGHRLTTFLLRYPKFIHAELMTHRVFSRNASSSRAIPVKRLIEDMRRDPAMPIFWGSNKPGMQAGSSLEGSDLQMAKEAWLAGMESAIACAEIMMNHDLHKQIANRVLEPWSHINVLVTSVRWANWYALRCHPDAQPEIQELASQMKALHDSNDPVMLSPGQWHLPFIQDPEWESIAMDDLKKISVARCARTSYLTHDMREPNFEQDMQLYTRLVGSEPLHASPAEHQATPDRIITEFEGEDHEASTWEYGQEHGNLYGWRQFRKQLPNEQTVDWI